MYTVTSCLYLILHHAHVIVSFVTLDIYILQPTQFLKMSFHALSSSPTHVMKSIRSRCIYKYTLHDVPIAVYYLISGVHETDTCKTIEESIMFRRTSLLPLAILLYVKVLGGEQRHYACMRDLFHRSAHFTRVATSSRNRHIPR